MRAWEVLGKKRPAVWTIKELHAQGLTDRQIAEKIGYLNSSITHARHRWGLPVNRVRNYDGWENSPAATETRRLHAKGLSDRQIANEMCISHKHAQINRWRLGLKPNREKTRKARIADIINTAAARGEYVRNIDLAQRFGTSEKTIAAFRHQLRAARLIPDDRPQGWRTKYALDGVAQPSRRPVPLPGGVPGDGSGYAAHGAD